jgi:hypothetical protein
MVLKFTDQIRAPLLVALPFQDCSAAPLITGTSL